MPRSTVQRKFPALEKNRKASFRKGLAKLGNDVYVVAQAAGIGNPGLDYVLCVGGQFVAVEVKRSAASKVTPRQRNTMERVRRAGGYAFVVYDLATEQHVLQFLRRIIDERRSHQPDE